MADALQKVIPFFRVIHIRSFNVLNAPPAKLGFKLTLEGYATGATEESTAYVGRFIKALKENKNFSDDFETIELGSMRRASIEGQEVMNFQLICTLKEKAKE